MLNLALHKIKSQFITSEYILDFTELLNKDGIFSSLYVFIICLCVIILPQKMLATWNPWDNIMTRWCDILVVIQVGSNKRSLLSEGSNNILIFSLIGYYNISTSSRHIKAHVMNHLHTWRQNRLIIWISYKVMLYKDI